MLELVIIGDGLTDATREKGCAFTVDDRRIHLILHDQHGNTAALRTGIVATSGI